MRSNSIENDTGVHVFPHMAHGLKRGSNAVCCRLFPGLSENEKAIVGLTVRLSVIDYYFPPVDYIDARRKVVMAACVAYLDSENIVDVMHIFVSGH